MTSHILYSYRRCPYAMRARMALHYAGIAVETREISLRDKPSQMLAASPKGTIPVLILPDETVIDESLNIMHWACAQRDTDDWLLKNKPDLQSLSQQLIAHNDTAFKHALDRYKYAERFPEHPASHYRAQGEVFLAQLNQRLNQHPYLMHDSISVADIAIFPFIRQFAAVDSDWFTSSEYQAVKHWLAGLVESALFNAVMQKHPTWQGAA